MEHELPDQDKDQRGAPLPVGECIRKAEDEMPDNILEGPVSTGY